VSYVIGCDPGSMGAFVVLDDKGNIISKHTMPLKKKVGTKNGKELDVRELVKLLYGLSVYNPTLWLERVWGQPKQSSVATFNFGKSFGILIGVVETIGIPIKYVAPRTWQSKLLDKGSGDTKDRSISTVKRLYPDESFIPKGCRKESDGLTDACLIALYGLREEKK